MYDPSIFLSALAYLLDKGWIIMTGIIGYLWKRKADENKVLKEQVQSHETRILLLESGQRQVQELLTQKIEALMRDVEYIRDRLDRE